MQTVVKLGLESPDHFEDNRSTQTKVVSSINVTSKFALVRLRGYQISRWCAYASPFVAEAYRLSPQMLFATVLPKVLAHAFVDALTLLSWCIQKKAVVQELEQSAHLGELFTLWEVIIEGLPGDSGTSLKILF